MLCRWPCGLPDDVLTPVQVALLYEFQLICCLWLKYFIVSGLLKNAKVIYVSR